MTPLAEICGDNLLLGENLLSNLFVTTTIMSINIFHQLYPTFNNPSYYTDTISIFESINGSQSPHEKYSANVLEHIDLFSLDRLNQGNPILLRDIQKQVFDIILQDQASQPVEQDNAMIVSRRDVLIMQDKAKKPILADPEIALGVWQFGSTFVQVDRFLINKKPQYKCWYRRLPKKNCKCKQWYTNSLLLYVHQDVLHQMHIDFDNPQNDETRTIARLIPEDINGSISELILSVKWAIYRTNYKQSHSYWCIWRLLQYHEYLSRVVAGDPHPCPVENVGTVRLPSSIHIYVDDQHKIRCYLKASDLFLGKYLQYESASHFVFIDLDQVIEMYLTSDQIHHFNFEKFRQDDGQVYVIPKISEDTLLDRSKYLGLMNFTFKIDVLEDRKLYVEISNGHTEKGISISINENNSVSYKEMVSVHYPFFLVKSSSTVDLFELINDGGAGIGVKFLFQLDSAICDANNRLIVQWNRRGARGQEVFTSKNVGDLELRKRKRQRYVLAPMESSFFQIIDTTTVLVRTMGSTYLFDMRGRCLMLCDPKSGIPDDAWYSVMQVYPLVEGHLVHEQDVESLRDVDMRPDHEWEGSGE